MAAISSGGGVGEPAVRRRRWPAWAAAGLALPAVLAGVSWWFTEPLVDPTETGESPAPTVVAAQEATARPEVRPTWPEGRLDGVEAKTRLLAIVEDASRRIDRFEGYTATFKKQERIGGTLGPEQTLAMKARHRPFAIYFKFLAPKAGKEVVFAEGHHGDKVVAHAGDWTRRLIPRLAVEPDSPVALAENRHPITDAGLSNLARKLVNFRKLDLDDREAVTVLDRTTDPAGKLWLRSVHLHPHPHAGRPFARVEVLYDPETLYPLQIRSYDWPAPGEDGPPPLAESYAYHDLAVDVPLSAIDFDPANPAYGFLRF